MLFETVVPHSALSNFVTTMNCRRLPPTDAVGFLCFTFSFFLQPIVLSASPISGTFVETRLQTTAFWENLIGALNSDSVKRLPVPFVESAVLVV